MRPLPNRSLQRNSKTKRNTDITGKDTNKRKHGGEDKTNTRKLRPRPIVSDRSR